VLGLSTSAVRVDARLLRRPSMKCGICGVMAVLGHRKSSRWVY
jgi:hypothetical protein